MRVHDPVASTDIHTEASTECKIVFLVQLSNHFLDNPSFPRQMLF